MLVSMTMTEVPVSQRHSINDWMRSNSIQSWKDLLEFASADLCCFAAEAGIDWITLSRNFPPTCLMALRYAFIDCAMITPVKMG